MVICQLCDVCSVIVFSKNDSYPTIRLNWAYIANVRLLEKYFCASNFSGSAFLCFISLWLDLKLFLIIF